MLKIQIIKDPVLIHVRTQKGKGYKPAEDSGDKYHGVSKFNVSTGEQSKNQNPMFLHIQKFLLKL